MTHPYLSDAACIHRLVEEYKQHKSLVVAYDFDNLVYDYHKKDHDYSDLIKLLVAAKSIGCYLIVFTAEEDTAKVQQFLQTNRIPFDVINENPPFFKSKSRKIYFNILLDDRAGLSSAYNQLNETINIIKNQLQ